MDSSGCNYSVEGGEFDYDATPLYTDQSFNSHEELTAWAQATAMSLGYVLVKGRSNTNSAGYARRMSVQEEDWVGKSHSLNTVSREIFAGLRNEFPNNLSTIKDVYNLQDKIRNDEAQQVGNTPMQVLLSVLQQSHYTYEYTTDVSSNRMENLFFMHAKSFEIWRAFPNVLIIDSTYKTNKYGMPFVEIVGVTSTGKTFLIACAFVVNEKEANYRWVLQSLKRTLGEGFCVSVIVTDRELALMNACRDVVPDAARQLCRVHIKRNIIKNCEMRFKNKANLNSFLYRWKLLIESRTIEDYIGRDLALQEYLENYPGVYRYVNLSWLSQYKELFVSCWVDEHLNFQIYNTNRVEAEHSLLKTHLRGQIARPHKLVECVTRIVEGQYIAIRESFSKSKIKRNKKHSLPCFRLLHGVVSHDALNIILQEIQRLKDDEIIGDSSRCGCKVFTSCGLPCACRLDFYVLHGQSITLDQIDMFWKKLDLTPSTCMEGNDIEKDDDEMNPDVIDEKIDSFKAACKLQPKSVAKSWLRKLGDIFIPNKTQIKEPVVQKKTRGRPSTQSKPAFKVPDMNKMPLNRGPKVLAKSRSMHSYGIDRASNTSNFLKSQLAPPRQSLDVPPVSYFTHDAYSIASYIPTTQSSRQSYDMSYYQDPESSTSYFPELFTVPTTPPMHRTPVDFSNVSISEIPKVFHPYVRRIRQFPSVAYPPE